MSTNAVADKKSVAARLVGMAQERYVLGVSEDGEPFGADRTRPHLSMLLRAGKAGLRAELASRYFAETGTVAGGQALTDATLVLEGLAASQTPEKLYLRIADHQGTSYIDTGRTDGKVVRIRAGTWSVIDTAPVRFLRTKLTAAMPLPARDSDLDRLWDFINVAIADRPVLLAVLVAALIQCDVPHPVLALFAEQGSFVHPNGTPEHDLQPPRQPDAGRDGRQSQEIRVLRLRCVVGEEPTRNTAVDTAVLSFGLHARQRSQHHIRS